MTVAILTGASRGIGACTARWLGSTGAAVVLVARDRERLGSVAADVAARGGEALVVVEDVAAGGAADRIVDAAVDRFGRIDVLVNNAAAAEPVQRLADADVAAWRRTYDVGLFAAVDLIRAALPFLRPSGGGVVDVVSEVALRPGEAIGAYATAKAALLHLTRTLAREEPDVGAFAYAPGPTDTALMDRIREAASEVMSADSAAAYRRLAESGKLVRPAHTARTLAWLALARPPDRHGDLVDHADPRAVAAAASALGEDEAVGEPGPVSRRS